MADKIHPASKPTATATASATATTPLFPPNKAQLYNSTRPVYRQPPRRSRRSCCCSFCLWITFSLLLLIILAAVAGGVFYVLYRPHRPSFSVSSLQISQFNLTSSNQLNTKLNFTVTARNPNKKIVFYYDPVNVKVESRGIDVGDGIIPAFVMEKKNTTRLRSVLSTSGRSLENDDNGGLRSDLKNKRRFPLTIRLDTKVKVKIGSVKTKKVPIRVVCRGIQAMAPAGKSATAATTSGVKCKVDLRIKIWKWTV